MGTFFDAFRFMVDHLGLLGNGALRTFVLSAAAMGVSMAVALPLGLWLGHLHRGSLVAINLSNVGRALPSLAVISINLALLGLGFLNVMVALVIVAIPSLLTNAYVAVDGVDREAVAAARGMGMRPWQVFSRVEFPLAVPLLFAGARTASIYVVGTATLASIAGGGGLGDIIFNQASYGLPGVVAAAIWVAAMALAVDLGLGAVQRLLTPRGLRAEPDAPVVGPPAAGTSGASPAGERLEPAATAVAR